MATSVYVTPAGQTELPTAAATPTQVSASAAGGPHPNVGAIIGVIVGTVVVVGALAFGFVYYRKRQRKQRHAALQSDAVAWGLSRKQRDLEMQQQGGNDDDDGESDEEDAGNDALRGGSYSQAKMKEIEREREASDASRCSFASCSTALPTYSAVPLHPPKNEYHDLNAPQISSQASTSPPGSPGYLRPLPQIPLSLIPSYRPPPANTQTKVASPPLPAPQEADEHPHQHTQAETPTADHHDTRSIYSESLYSQASASTHRFSKSLSRATTASSSYTITPVPTPDEFFGSTSIGVSGIPPSAYHSPRHSEHIPPVPPLPPHIKPAPVHRLPPLEFQDDHSGIPRNARNASPDAQDAVVSPEDDVLVGSLLKKRAMRTSEVDASAKRAFSIAQVSKIERIGSIQTVRDRD